MPLTPDLVLPRLRGSFGRVSYVHVDRCESTQRLPAADAAHGTVAVAEHQTAGRGRLGRVWVDEPGASLLLSVVLRPTRPVHEWPGLTPVAGEAAAAAIEAVTGARPAIKPPNDLLVGGAKVAGILAEVRGGAIVLGIGINVGATPFPGSAALGGHVDRVELLSELLVRLEQAFAAWDVAAGS